MRILWCVYSACSHFTDCYLPILTYKEILINSTFSEWNIIPDRMSASVSDCDGPSPSQAVIVREGEGSSVSGGGVMLGDNF